MRLILAFTIFSTLAVAQVDSSVPVPIDINTLPLAPLDLTSPYASPRDAARHRFQVTLLDLQTKRDVRAAVRGFGEALALDSTYYAAAFDMAVVAAIGERWDDAIAAFQEAASLDSQALGALAKPAIERLQLISRLEKTSEGKRRRQYDEALLPLLAKLPSLPESEAMAALTEVGRIDSKRWESPALLAGLSGGNGRGYEAATKYLEIASANATDPAVKASLRSALAAADREMRFAAARAAAEAAADGGENDKAAELFEAAWSTIPARAQNGLDAASERLLQDDTARAAAILARLKDSGDTKLADSAAAMLKHLEPLEPAAKNSSADSAEFFRDPAQRNPFASPPSFRQ